MSGLAFRLAEASDAALVRAVSAEAYIPAYRVAIGVVPKPALEDYGERIARKEVWLAETEGAAAGVVVLEPRADHWLVHSLAVRPRYQRRGFGKALLGFAETLAGEMGVPELRLHTNWRMERNLALYRACGFVDTGTRAHPSRAGEMLVDMAKAARPAAERGVARKPQFRPRLD